MKWLLKPQELLLGKNYLVNLLFKEIMLLPEKMFSKLTSLTIIKSLKIMKEWLLCMVIKLIDGKTSTEYGNKIVKLNKLIMIQLQLQDLLI